MESAAPLQEYYEANRQLYEKAVRVLEQAIEFMPSLKVLYASSAGDFKFVIGEPTAADFIADESTDTLTPREWVESQKRGMLDDAQYLLTSHTGLLAVFNPDRSDFSSPARAETSYGRAENYCVEGLAYDDEGLHICSIVVSKLYGIDAHGSLGESAMYQVLLANDEVADCLSLMTVEGKVVGATTSTAIIEDELHTRCCEKFGADSLAVSLLHDGQNMNDDTLEAALATLKSTMLGIYDENEIEHFIVEILQRIENQRAARELEEVMNDELRPAADKVSRFLALLETLH